MKTMEVKYYVHGETAQHKDQNTRIKTTLTSATCSMVSWSKEQRYIHNDTLCMTFMYLVVDVYVLYLYNLLCT